MSDMPRVLILSGGISHERDISLKSGRKVADGLTSHGMSVELRDPDGTLIEHLRDHPPEVIWPVLHGASGEDGALRALLGGVDDLGRERVLAEEVLKETASYAVESVAMEFDDLDVDEKDRHLRGKPMFGGAYVTKSLWLDWRKSGDGTDWRSAIADALFRYPIGIFALAGSGDSLMYDEAEVSLKELHGFCTARRTRCVTFTCAGDNLDCAFRAAELWYDATSPNVMTFKSRSIGEVFRLLNAARLAEPDQLTVSRLRFTSEKPPAAQLVVTRPRSNEAESGTPVPSSSVAPLASTTRP